MNELSKASRIRVKLHQHYKPPFRYDNRSYIFDADNNMVCDFRSDGNTIRPRGWGRFQYMPDGELIHDEMAKYLVYLTKDFPTDPVRCEDALNKAWKNRINP